MKNISVVILFFVSNYFFVSCSQPSLSKDGGLRITIQVDELPATREKCKEIFKKRLDHFGIEEATVISGEKPGIIVIEFPGTVDKKRLLTLLQVSSKIEFAETYDNRDIYTKLDQLNKSLAKENGAVQDSVIKEEPVSGGTLKEQLKRQEQPKQSELQMKAANPLFAILSPAITMDADRNYILEEGPAIGYSTEKDTARVNAIFKTEEAKDLFGNYIKFLWSFKPFIHGAYSLIAIKTKYQGETALSGDIIRDAKLVYDSPNGRPQISMTMSPEAALAWKKLTAANIGKPIAICYNGQVYGYPVVQGEIASGVSTITGNFTRAEAEDFVNVLISGFAPTSIEVIKEEIIQPHK